VERQPSSNASTIMIEGGDDFEESDEEIDEENEPNFNRADDAPVPAGAVRNGGASGDANRRRRRRGRGGRGPGSGGGGTGGRR
jgi:polyribonucleotide nucleotidyltransferase